MRREEQIVHPDKGPLALAFLLGAVRARPRDLPYHGKVSNLQAVTRMGI